MKRLLRTLALFAFALSLAAAAGLAYAQGGVRLPAPKSMATQAGLFGLWGGNDGQQQAQSKAYTIHDDDTFAKKTKSFSMMPYNKADLEYEIYLPADWTPEDKTMNQNGLQNITGIVAQFWSPMIVTQRATAIVEVLQLKNEISARNWLKDFLIKSGYLVDGEVEEINNRAATGKYTRADTDGATWWCYISARVSGSYVVTARFEVPVNLKGYLGYLQKKSIDSFKLLYPKDDPVEPQKVFTLVDALKFNYPESWDVSNPDFRDMNRLSVELKNIREGNRAIKGQIVDGYIRLLAVRRTKSTDLMTEVEAMRKFFNDTMEVEFLKMNSTGKSDAYERFLFNRYEVYDVQGKGKIKSVNEVHLVVLGDKDWYVFAFLLTPKESFGIYNWARNVQTFQLVIKSIK